jgi:hypothetical protein
MPVGVSLDYRDPSYPLTNETRSMMRHKLGSLLAALVLLAAACAGVHQTNGPGLGERNLITAEQIARINVESAFHAVERLRPEWLTSRGATSLTNPTPTAPSVFIGGVQVGDFEYLRRILPDDILEIRYIEAAQAGARFGMGHQRGVIEVVLKGSRN